MKNQHVVICPLCGERAYPRGFLSGVALATKRGAKKQSLILPLLPRLTAVLPPQGREITTHGFTLIELLVVVLIIGILAAVAVPQYQKVVLRSKLAKMKAIVSPFHYAQERYYLNNGTYANSFNILDIDKPVSFEGFTCGVWSGAFGNVGCSIRDKNNVAILGYTHYNDNGASPGNKGKRICCSETTMGQQICTTDTNHGTKSGNCFYY